MAFASPIEEKMAEALRAFGAETYASMLLVMRFGVDLEICRQDAQELIPEHSYSGQIYPHVRIGPYEVDFLLLFKNAEGRLLSIAIECDGHEFHDKTKQQAARDRRRDRYLAVHSIIMMRFTGSEIWHEPDMCADEVRRAMVMVASGPRERPWCGLPLTERQMDVLEREARDQQEIEQRIRQYQEQIEEHDRLEFIKSEIMSGTYEGYYP